MKTNYYTSEEVMEMAVEMKKSCTIEQANRITSLLDDYESVVKLDDVEWHISIECSVNWE